MLIELKRCNSIGDVPGVLFLMSMLYGKDRIERREIAGRCALENGVFVNCNGTIAFFEYLGFVKTDAEYVYPKDKVEALAGKDSDTVISCIVESCLSQMIEDGIFDSDALCFDPEKGHLSIHRSAFPLAYAAIRNFLTTVGVLDKEQSGQIGILESYESEFSSIFRERKQKFTLEQLLEKQEAQSKRGLEAEEFVLRLEKERLPFKANRIKRISDFDVSAGYDIVSFKESESEKYDRFIEVKCYLGKEHFYWSENEVDTARIRGENYILCLVDYDMIKCPGYKPKYIINPYEVIFKDETWLVNTASYRVEKI